MSEPRLSELRVISSIPKALPDTKYSDKDGAFGDQLWQYPSPKMFYEAIRKKGKMADPSQMNSIIAIHNVINEQTWQHICWWEKRIAELKNTNNMQFCNKGPKLLRFMGKPENPSPRALLNRILWGYSAPFDRHDWWIQRSDGSVIRYVIDFYSGREGDSKESCTAQPVVYLDVRPALDSFSNFKERINIWFSQKNLKFFK